MQNNCGFNLNQLVFAFNPNFPTVIDNEVHVMEAPFSNIIHQNMNALHCQTKSWLQSRVKRCGELSGIACPYTDVVYTNGDNVYYYRKNYKEWKGPAVILGKDGNVY